jgi:carbonic anhydrase/acetyltransferase-like protein (isoleucine patch superfamily)
VFQYRTSRVAWLRHTNPDGSLGGLVSVGATVGADVYLDVSAVVIADAHVPDHSVVGPGVIVSAAGSISFSESRHL